MRNAILKKWREVLTNKRDLPALLSPAGETLRHFGEIQDSAERFVRQLNEIPGRTVALCAGNVPDWPAAFLALQECGCATLLLEPSALEAEGTKRLFERCGVTAVVQLDGRGGVGITLTGYPARPGLSADVLKVTSGTTSEPRAILFEAAQLLADCENVCDTMGIADTDLNFGVLSWAHSYGFSNLVTPLLCRGVPMVATTDRMPRSILEGLCRSGATVFPGTPVFFQKLAELGIGKDAGALRLCISAGAPLPPQDGERFFKQTGRKIHIFYGSSECGGICYDAEEEPFFATGYVGRPMRNVVLEWADQEEQTGRIVVTGTAVGSGYFPDGDPEVLGGGRFLPGDLLESDRRGYRIVGRVSDLINVAGRKVNPSEVEAVLMTIRNVRRAVVFGLPSANRGEMPVACVVGQEVTEEDLRSACASRLAAWQIPKRFWFVDEIPVNERGKISRIDLARRFGTAESS